MPKSNGKGRNKSKKPARLRYVQEDRCTKNKNRRKAREAAKQGKAPFVHPKI